MGIDWAGFDAQRVMELPAFALERITQIEIVAPVSFSDTSHSFLARRGSVAGSLGGCGACVSLAK